MDWQIFFLINLLTASVREYLNKRIADSIDPLVGFFQMMAFSSGWLYFIYGINFQSFPEIDLKVGLTGIFFIAGFIAYLKSVKYSLSQSILFQSYSILVTLILTALFLGEKKYFDISTTVGKKIVAGGVLAVLAIWFLLHFDKKREEKLELRWLFYIVTSIFFFGIGSFSSIYFIRQSSIIWVLIQQLTVMVPILWLLNIFSNKKVILPKKLMMLTFLSSVFSTIAALSFFQALTIVPVAKFLPLQQVSLVIITMFTGILFFKEARFFSSKRLLGMGLGLFGIILLVTA